MDNLFDVTRAMGVALAADYVRFVDENYPGIPLSLIAEDLDRLAELGPNPARPSGPLSPEAVERARATLLRLPSTPPEAIEDHLAKLDPVDGCGCGFCDLIATIMAGLDGGESCEHRWFEVSRWGNPQRRWLRCSECGEAVEEVP